MKNIILTIAIVLVCAILIIGQADVLTLQREGYKAKNLADEMSRAAALSIDPASYSNGYIVFDYDKGCSLAKEILKCTGGYDDNYSPAGGYFKDSAVVDLYFFDQSEICRHYQNGIYKAADDFSFEFADSKKLGEYITAFSDEEYMVKYPCVCIVYHAGRPSIKASFISGLARVSKKSVYEYKTL